MTEKTFTRQLIACSRCPRLVSWREKVAREKRMQFKDQTYWGKPVPSFGGIGSQLLIVGLAPAAHGANRTGRMFTGDESGRWLYRALYRAGFSSKELSENAHDGLKLFNARITAVVHCAPPGNKPLISERDTCRKYLYEELKLMKHCHVILCLGGYAWESTLHTLALLGNETKPKPRFGHGASTEIGPFRVFASYHPSQQNTFTGKLTEKMLDSVFQQIKNSLS